MWPVLVVLPVLLFYGVFTSSFVVGVMMASRSDRANVSVWAGWSLWMAVSWFSVALAGAVLSGNPRRALGFERMPDAITLLVAAIFGIAATVLDSGLKGLLNVGSSFPELAEAIRNAPTETYLLSRVGQTLFSLAIVTVLCGVVFRRLSVRWPLVLAVLPAAVFMTAMQYSRPAAAVMGAIYIVLAQLIVWRTDSIIAVLLLDLVSATPDVLTDRFGLTIGTPLMIASAVVLVITFAVLMFRAPSVATTFTPAS